MSRLLYTYASKGSIALCICLSIHLSVFAQGAFPEKQAIEKIVTPLTLNQDTTTIYLADYFIDPAQIDSVYFSKGIKYNWDKKSETIFVTVQEELKPLAEMKLWSKGYPYSVILKRSTKKAYQFTYDPQGKKVTSVQLAGEMNDWTPKKTPFHQVGDKWVASINLDPGSYQYQIVVDDRWILDPADSVKVENDNGGFNSLFTAGHPSADKPSIATSKLGPESFTISIKYLNPTFSFAVYWQNFRLGRDYVKHVGDEMMITIPEQAKKKERSYIRIFCSDTFSIGNDILLPLQNGAIVRDPSLITRSDKHGDVIYFVLVDRFCNGDSSNDKKIAYPVIKPQTKYSGGDLESIRKKINDGYFKSLNINTLWISPIAQNPETAFRGLPEPHDWHSGFPGYLPQIDHCLGTEKAFKRLTDDAYKNNINVVIDLLANHVLEDYPLIKKHSECYTQTVGKPDLNLYLDARVAFAKDDVTFDKLAATLQECIDLYGSHHLMGNISGDHDLPRLTSSVAENRSFTEDARKGGSERDIKTRIDSAYYKMAMFIAFINAIPGVPVLYYGDEITMHQAAAHDYVSMTVIDEFNDSQKKLKETVADLFALRTSHLALMYGETSVSAKGNTMIIKRSYFSEQVVFVFNKSLQTQSIETGVNIGAYKPQFGHKGSGTSVELPPLSFEVFVGRKSAAGN